MDIGKFKITESRSQDFTGTRIRVFYDWEIIGEFYCDFYRAKQYLANRDNFNIGSKASQAAKKFLDIIRLVGGDAVTWETCVNILLDSIEKAPNHHRDNKKQYTWLTKKNKKGGK